MVDCVSTTEIRDSYQRRAVHYYSVPLSTYGPNGFRYWSRWMWNFRANINMSCLPHTCTLLHTVQPSNQYAVTGSRPVDIVKMTIDLLMPLKACTSRIFISSGVTHHKRLRLFYFFSHSHLTAWRPTSFPRCFPRCGRFRCQSFTEHVAWTAISFNEVLHCRFFSHCRLETAWQSVSLRCVYTAAKYCRSNEYSRRFMLK